MTEEFQWENMARQLRAYAEEVYAQEEVAELCLAMQDAFGLDVNLLLAAGFCGEMGLAWTSELLVGLQHVSAGIRRDYILPLREVRRRAKGVAPDSVYQPLKSAELALEFWQLEAVARALPRPDHAGADCIQANLALFAAQGDVALQGRLRRLADLLREIKSRRTG